MTVTVLASGVGRLIRQGEVLCLLHAILFVRTYLQRRLEASVPGAAEELGIYPSRVKKTGSSESNTR